MIVRVLGCKTRRDQNLRVSGLRGCATALVAECVIYIDGR